LKKRIIMVGRIRSHRWLIQTTETGKDDDEAEESIEM
jgi:hypothetical protein